MEQYSKPTRLVPLQLYSPFQSTAPFRRLISRDQERLRAKSFKTSNDNTNKNQNRGDNVMSFTRLYSQPAVIFTSLHERQILGRIRKPKNLPPLTRKHYTSRLSKTTEIQEKEKQAFSLELSGYSNRSDIVDYKSIGADTTKSENPIEFYKDAHLIEEIAENQESELVIEKPENFHPVITTVEKFKNKEIAVNNLNQLRENEDKEIEEEFKALKNLENTKQEDKKLEDDQEKNKVEEVVIPKLNIPTETNYLESEDSARRTPISIPNIQIFEEQIEAHNIAENSCLTYEIPGIILKLNSAIINVEGVDFDLKLPLSLLKHVVFGTDLDIITNVTISVFIGNNQLTFMKKENYSTSFAEISEKYSQILFHSDFQRAFLLLKPNAVKRRVIGQTIKKLESAGLSIKANKIIKPSKELVEEFYKDLSQNENYKKIVEELIEGPAVIMCWEGSNALAACKKIIKSIDDKLSPDSPVKSSIYYPENTKDTEKQLNLWFSEEERNSWDYHKTPVIIKTKQTGHIWKISLPTVEVYAVGVSAIRPIPLGLLKQMIEANFNEWNEKWLNYFKLHELEEKSLRARRSGTDTSSLKANTVQNEKTVILSLNAPEVILKNNEIEAKYSYKIEDIASLLALFEKNREKFLENLVIGCKISSLEVRKKKVWKLKLVIDSFEFLGNNDNKLEPCKADVMIDGTTYNCQFIMPTVDIYDPETKKQDYIILDSEICEKLVISHYENWELVCLEFFDNKFRQTNS
ncbi:unnamed protein product [Blepharisma stoltei]|uniref:nucleoside-diphosphate kinase n=1 Tax=Blepharisma stoltei TaxID=1481888 RepID=A0AAU9JXW1_9CILI|nr:unnamed protein product [Blepharisma stoltei]